MQVTMPWSDADRARLKTLHGTMSIAELAAALGRTKGGIRSQVTLLGLSKKVGWSREEEEELRQLYEAAGVNGVLRLSEFAVRVGRHKANVCRKAISMGLVTNPHRKLVEARKDRRKYRSPEEAKAGAVEARREYYRSHPHPKGFQGKTHSPEALRKISSAAKAYHLFLTEEQRQERITKAMKTKVDRYGSVAVQAKRGSWAAGWREIGDKRNYYRSRWEANYARYLQWLKEHGQIADWQHEPETFWFEQIKRGTRSYLPDFRVWENDGSSALHEVKGWMDQRSRTTLNRMRKYYPHEKLVLIDGAQYRAIRLKVMRLIPGWEDSPRDTHA